MPHNPDMVWWRQVDCPVRPAEQDWIERSMDWFVAQFGTERLHGEVVLPTDDYFPGAYQGTREDMQVVLETAVRPHGCRSRSGGPGTRRGRR
jgi:hypothetical protein